MANTRPANGSTRRRAGLAAVGVAALVGIVIVIVALRSPPQMGANKEVFRTVDALFTAVTGHDEKRLGDCERRLAGYRVAGTLPADAADFLESVIRQARSGQWQTASERLYDFMRSQRREGPGRR